MKFIHKKINEGFENPFDSTAPSDLKYINDFGEELNVNNRVKIGGVKLWNTNTRGKIEYDPRKKRMISGKHFAKDDIVEICPYIELAGNDMYSKNIRDTVFTINPETGIYALPLGYALCYRNSMEVPGSDNGNILYEVDENDKTIRFIASKKIRPGEELIIFADDSDFQNEIKPGQFKYDTDSNAIYSVKNFKIV